MSFGYMYVHCLMYVLLAINVALKLPIYDHAAVVLYLCLAALSLVAHKS